MIGWAAFEAIVKNTCKTSDLVVKFYLLGQLVERDRLDRGFWKRDTLGHMRTGKRQKLSWKVIKQRMWSVRRFQTKIWRFISKLLGDLPQAPCCHRFVKQLAQRQSTPTTVQKLSDAGESCLWRDKKCDSSLQSHWRPNYNDRSDILRRYPWHHTTRQSTVKHPRSREEW